MIRIEEIIDKVEENHPQANLEMIRKAYLFSALHHRGQKRASGEPYLVHPLEVSNILADMRLDETVIATGLLHDVVEDTLIDLDTIKKQFGSEVTLLVDGLTKIAHISNLSKEEQQAENVRKMVLAMITDVRVVLVKPADRLHNMRTMEFLKPEKRKRISLETLEIYAPIAHRLGMGKVRSELEDLSFRNLYPEEYEELNKEMETRRPELEAALGKITQSIEEKLKEADIPFIRIEGRIKRLFSLWRKLKKRKLNIEQVYDLVAARIITTDKKYCYSALGVIHDIWIPVPERFKDWIAMPRDNMYQSLHTSVIGDGGQSFEVQIRTEEMHNIAEEGVAAHWKYKDNKLGSHDDDDSLNELRDKIEKLLIPLVESSEDIKDSQEFIESLKLDLYPKDVYAFTPMGKVIQLPRGSTPIDFAYAIHSQVGDTCTGAKINKRIVPLRTEIQNGDMIEILTTSNSNPSRDWLNYVVTSKARNRIRHFISEQQRSESIEMGRKLLEKEADRFQIKVKKMFQDTDGDLKRIANEYGLGRIDDLLASIGYGKIIPRNIIQKYLGSEKFAELDPDGKKDTVFQTGVKAVKKFVGMGDDSIIVSGVGNMMITRGRCCNPLRGEPIIGYISLGKGIVVHNKQCKNVKQLMINKDRIVPVEWAGKEDNEAFAVRLQALTENRNGMIADITGSIADIKTGIRNAQAKVSNDGQGLIEVTVEVFDLRHLEKVINAVKKVSGVIDVERMDGLSDE